MHCYKKAALLVLAAVVLWTAMPASACMLLMPSSASPTCCDGMPKDGAPRSLSVLPSCCQIRGTTPAVTPAPPFSPEQSMQPLFVAFPASLPRSATANAGWRSVQVAPPPKFSAGQISILRI